MTVTLLRDLAGLLCDPADFIVVVHERIGCDLLTIDGFGFPCAEVETTGELTHHHHVEALLCDRLAQRTRPPKLRIEMRRAEIAEQSEGLPKLQKPGLRTLLRWQLIPVGLAHLAADRTHEHGICGLAGRDRRIRQRLTICIDGAAAHQHLLKRKLVTIDLGYLLEHLLGLGHDLRTDAISRYRHNLCIHRHSSPHPLRLSVFKSQANAYIRILHP